MTKELTTQENQFVAVIEKAVMNPDVDVQKMQQLLDVQERIMNKNAETAFNQAMAELQPMLPQITRDRKGHNSKYASYEAIDKQIRDKYTSCGFSISFNSRIDNGKTIYTATLSHKDGHSTFAEIALDADTSGNKNSIQAIGSTTSYARRYLLGMLFNLVFTDEDDDGQAAGATITQNQVKVIERKLGDPEREPAFCKHYGIERIADLPKSKFDQAIAAIEKKNNA